MDNRHHIGSRIKKSVLAKIVLACLVLISVGGCQADQRSLQMTTDLSESDHQPLLLMDSQAYGDSSWSGGYLNTETGEIHTFLENLVPLGWSPSGKKLLLSSSNALYVSLSNGDEMSLLFNASGNRISRSSRWLNESEILLELEEKRESVIHYYPLLILINEHTGEVEKLERETASYFVAASPDGSFWLERQGGLSVANKAGINERLLEGLDVRTNRFAEWKYPLLGFLPDGSGLVYIAIDEGIFLLFVSALDNEIIMPGKPIYNIGESLVISSLHISPNGQFVVMYEGLRDGFIVIEINTSTVILEYFDFDFYFQPTIVWSPDSNAIAFTTETEEGFEIYQLDIKSSEVQLLWKDHFFHNLVEWRMIPAS